jgi:hypothetical protein
MITGHALSVWPILSVREKATGAAPRAAGASPHTIALLRPRNTKGTADREKAFMSGKSS